MAGESIAVLFLFATVGLRVALVLLVVWLVVPRRQRCPVCGEATDALVSPRLLRWCRLERRWCLGCGWAGVAKAVRPARAGTPVSTSSALPLLALALGTTGCAPAGRDLASVFADSSAWVDLTHPFNAQTVYWPTSEPFRLERVAAGYTDAGYYYAANNFRAAEHGGTHLDAPIHFAEGGHTSDAIPLGRLVGAAVVIDVAPQAAADPDYRATVADLEAFERAHGRIPAGAIVLVRTGWGARWPDPAAYLGTDRRGAAAVPLLRFPGIAPDAARWLVAERAVDAVGIDTPSIDRGQSTTFETHQILFAANIPAFENVANLDRLPPTGAYVIALPMKIEGGSGGPLRIVAVVP